jgi:hypothetical protein
VFGSTVLEVETKRGRGEGERLEKAKRERAAGEEGSLHG